ncbi:MAG: hypothetical protein CMG64_05630 [Candidatus Marinimicrobia bacterium]|nr:hypothetical protein [Candidatus Neomarinimicrobiota bacterium]|tara:strand:- start:1698 stop:4010 length:2313 start_codon:yes stop_codon:yes gene_type:complete
MDKQNQSSFEDSREYSISEILFIIRKHYKLSFLIFFITLFFTIYYTLAVKPQYRSTSMIMVNEDQKSRSMLNMGLDANRNFISNEIQVLKSRTTSQLTIEKLLDSEYRNDLYILGTKKYEPNFYRTILTFGLLDNSQNIVDVDSEIFAESSDAWIDFCTKELMKSISVKNEKNTDVLSISITSLSPFESSLLVNTLIDIYKKRDIEWVTGEMSHLKHFLVDQLSEKEIELNQIENKLKEFQESEKIFSLDDNSKLILENLTQFETQYNNILAEINIIEEREKYLNAELTADEKGLVNRVSNTINNRLFALKNEIDINESELISTITQYGENHSAVISLKNKINKLRTQLGDETKSLIENGISSADPILYRQTLMDSVISIKAIKANLNSKSISYKEIVDLYDKKLSDLPDKALKLTQLERDRSILSQTYSFMKSKLEEARIGEASKLGKIRILDKAISNSKPIKPNKIKNIFLGVILGCILGLGIPLLIEFFDNTIRSIEQLERRGLSVLSIIPDIMISSNKKNKNNKKYLNRNMDVLKLQRRLITHEDPKSPVSEAYRSLRTSLMYTESESNCQILLVSSAGPGEGKTTSIANLAITYANLGKKTLLIDSDLRKPVIHNVFKLDKTPGLTSFLSKNSSYSDILNKTDIKNLDVITSGIIPPNPSELLASNSMQKFIAMIREEYDVVLFDSPPLIAVTDPYVLMKYVDQFVLVVRSGVTQRGALQRVLEVVGQTDFDITGVIMNAVSESDAYGSGYYYNYYQYYYGESDK